MKTFLRQRLSHRRGFTLLESTIAISLITVLSLGGVSLTLSAISSWNKDVAQGTLETEVGLAIRQIADELRPAVSIMVDTDGMGLTYWLPAHEADGTLTIPLQTDGVERRLEVDSRGEKLYIDGRTRPVLTGLDLPIGARLFSLRPGHKALEIRIESSTTADGKTYRSYRTEIISLRNYQ